MKSWLHQVKKYVHIEDSLRLNPVELDQDYLLVVVQNPVEVMQQHQQ